MDIREEVILREHRVNAGNDDWKSASTDATEVTMPSLIVLRDRLAGGGVLRWSHIGDFTFTAGGPANLALKLYSETSIAHAALTLLLTHTIAITGAAGAGAGYFQWDLEIRPLGTGDGTNVQWITSKLTYLRNGADTEQSSTQRFRTTIDFGALDLYLKTSFQKANTATWVIDVAQVYATLTAPRSGT